ncbi:MAG TPA: cytochrome C oxidase subunit IV family protein [Flavobacteriales bacterium]|nr:cytochrome C oxidase subunit IV family protein [Flavobacteriales bacterium]
MEDRDDIIEYSLYNHHNEEEGKKIRKKIWKVTFILTAITAFEIFMGVSYSKGVMEHTSAWMWIKLLYVVLTIGKAAFIVIVFMHLGDERKAFKWCILAPYILFIIYLFVICRHEGLSVIWGAYGT